MNEEILKTVLFYSLGILTGAFLVICGIVNPKKLIIDNLTESNFKNKKKYIYFKRILLLVTGLLFIAITFLFWLNIFDRSYSTFMILISVLIMQAGNLIIFKKYTFKNNTHRRKN